MRITNKIIQNNSINNINANKTLEDTLSTQIATKKKISRPSDDPIIALRSLRLRTSVNQTSQYVDKNVEDAKSWLTVTEDAIDMLSDVITDIRKQYTKASSDTLKSEDRKIIIEDLKSLACEVYSTGNVDFAGRSVFTGFRTGESLTFQKQQDISYTIKETGETAALDSISYINTGDTEQDVYEADITRIRLSYDDCDTGVIPAVTINGNDVTANVVSMNLSDDPNPYETVVNDSSAIVYVAETGELLVGSDYGDTESITDFEVSYTKSKWENGDLRPEHYFICEDTTNNISYTSYGGEIEYNIGTNQTLRINTTAGECFTHDIVRDLDDMVNALTEVENIEETISELTVKLNSLDENDATGREAVQTRIDAAKKAQTYLNEKLQGLASAGITKADGYLDANNVALTNCGTRSKRLELIENRLDTQLSTLKELKSDNEDVDLTTAAIELSNVQTSYDAALLATSKILKESLLNYI